MPEYNEKKQRRRIRLLNFLSVFFALLALGILLGVLLHWSYNVI